MRSSGVLMHITSLPSPYGIGTIGDEARRFVDFLVDAGQTWWQVLPTCPTGFADSPYQSFSTYAGNPYFIDLEYLCYDGLVTKEEIESYPWGTDDTQVDYGQIFDSRFRVLRLAYSRFKHRIPWDYQAFCEKNRIWLEDYALYMTLKDIHEKNPWNKWDEKYRMRDEKALDEIRQSHGDDVGFWMMTQYIFYAQWRELRKYANERGIKLIGDVPIYVSFDSSDIWGDPKQFYLDEELNLKDVAGVPPDAFSEDGQLWGNPLFDWDYMKKDDYTWWTNRVKHLAEMFDIVRIDHFRGFESYYAIPAKDDTAKNGEWRKGPGIELFRALERKLGKLDIIVEDLGYLTQDVKDMLKASGYPGMKLMQFAFDSREDGDYLPHNYTSHSVVYTGTHDNDTILGWMETAPKESVAFAKEYLHLDEKEGYNWGMMRAIWASVSDMAIVTMQDLLDLGSEARMNTPSTTGTNWKWRMKKGAATRELAEKVRGYTALYSRLRS